MNASMEEITLDADGWVAIDGDSVTDSSGDMSRNTSLFNTSDLTSESPAPTPQKRPAPPPAKATAEQSAPAASSWGGFWSRLGDGIGESFSALGEKVTGTIDSIDDRLAISSTMDGVANKMNSLIEKPPPPKGFKKVGQCDDGDPYKNPLIDDDELQYL
jgi:hypothetical protein